jgi:hypothetical protein
MTLPLGTDKSRGRQEPGPEKPYGTEVVGP